MQADRRHLLDEALVMSRRMRDLGEAGEWDKVLDLEPQRRGLLEQVFATRQPVDEDLASRVREILDLDKGLMRRSLQVRDQVASELGQFQRSRKASGAYRASAS